MNNVLLTVWMERQTHWIAIKTLLIVVSVGAGGKSSRCFLMDTKAAILNNMSDCG